MINLIPPQARTAVTREYWTRVVSVWGFLFGGVAVALIALLIPTYLLVHLQLVALEQEIHSTNGTEQSVQVAEAANKEANTYIAVLDDVEGAAHVSDLFAVIVATAGSDITLSALAVVDEVEAMHIRVQGVAQTRGALVAFQNNMQRLPQFDEVAVPVPDLAREVDAPFTMTVVVTEDITH